MFSCNGFRVGRSPGFHYIHVERPEIFRPLLLTFLRISRHSLLGARESASLRNQVGIISALPVNRPVQLIAGKNRATYRPTLPKVTEAATIQAMTTLDIVPYDARWPLHLSFLLQLKDDRQVRPEIRALLSPVTIKFNFQQRCHSRLGRENATFNYFL